jgi:hypothetical protein
VGPLTILPQTPTPNPLSLGPEKPELAVPPSPAPLNNQNLKFILMMRYQAICSRCAAVSQWNQDRRESLREIRAHLEGEHQVEEAREDDDFRIVAQNQCHYCLEEFLDRCTKCEKDYCQVHEGFIHGYCGNCI